MAKGSQMKMLGLALIVVGLGLAFWGFQMSDSMGSQLSRLATGSDTDKVMTLYIGGAASFIIGLFLFTKK